MLPAGVDRDVAIAAAPIPVTILTGFLGAGKTTLLNRILNGDHGLRVAVLVNDFGAVNIDAELVVGVESGVVSLANGCVCCTIRDDLVDAVLEAVDRPEKPECILLEASGVADPAGIAMTFNGSELRDRLRLDGILCVVDADQLFASPETMELKVFQMACADMVILNKVDLVDRGRIDGIKAWLDERFHRYRLIESIRCNVPVEVALAAGRLDPARASVGRDDGERHDAHAGHDHSATFDTWCWESDAPLSLAPLREAASRLPAGIYRAKGVVRVAEAAERRAVLQVVGRRVDISLDAPWGGRTPKTRIVAIGAAGAVDAEALSHAFEQCAARA